MNSPTPALVTQQAARRLPRVPLLLLCLAYLVPGLIGRDPWKNADLMAFGYMANMARGVSTWMEPALGGIAGTGSLLPYWIGAAAIRLLGPWLGDPLAARLPFMLLLAATLWMSWWTTYYLARTEAAQPAPFAFGGEAHPVDYARAIADGALLALIASLGLLQLGHETTPELLQLAGVTLFVLGLAVAPFHPARAHVAVLVALPALTASGSPAMAVLLGLVGLVTALRSTYPSVRTLAWTLVAAIVLGGIVASALNLWSWRLGSEFSLRQLGRLLAWFTWPAWPLALWTLWRWRGHLLRRHMVVPLGAFGVALGASIFMGGSDRALLLGLPSLATLAAFALPTLKRSFSSLIDWFALFFFTFWALLFWVVYTSLQFGWPAKPAANVLRLLPGYTHGPLNVWVLGLAAAASLAWLGLVRWRTGRQQHPLWTSLVLPASGVALGWLLVMSLHLPVLNYARSYRPMLDQMARVIPPGSCVDVIGGEPLRAALESMAGYRVHGMASVQDKGAARCDWRVLAATVSVVPPEPPPGWRRVQMMRRPGDKDEAVVIFRRP